MGKKLWITTGIIGALAAAYTAGGFLGVPYGVNWALKKYAEPIVGRTITTQEVKFNPFTLQFSVKGLNVQKDGEPPLLSVGYLKTKVLWNSLFKLSPLVQYITVDELNSTVIRTGLDTFNFSDIITRIQEMPSSPEEDKEDKKDDKPLQFSIGNINLTNSSITLDDKFRHKVDKVTDLNFALPLISNFQNDVDVPITPDLRFNFNGEPFAINAESVPFTPGKKTGVNFTVTGLSLENAASFNPIPLNVKVTKGTMDCAFNLDFEKKQGEENAYLRLKGTVKMKDVGLEDEIGKAYQIIGVKEIDANLKEFAFFRQNLDIGEIQLHNPSVVVIRDSDSLNLVQLLTHIVKEQKAQVKQDAKEAKEKSALPADEKKTPNDWSWNIDKVSVRNGTINFTDTTNNFKRSATNVNVTLAPINGEDGTRTSIDASVGAIGGHIQANGGMVITPFSMDLNLQSSGLSIADLTPYISQYSGAHVTQGTFSNKGELKLNLAKAVSFSYTGSADVASLNVTDKQGAPAVSLKNLAVGGISVSGLSPLQISLGSIALTSPNVNVVMNKNGSINLASLGTPSSAPAPAAKADSSAASKPQPKAQVSASSSSSPAINVGKITLTDGRVRYTDNSIEPTFKLNASNLAGSLSNYSTTIKGNATIDVKGLLN
ncbi:MAG TPA: ATPase, partial [Sutterellaceae bacterium]|nr:ATPase [Sutterellaceae bacterium]